MNPEDNLNRSFEDWQTRLATEMRQVERRKPSIYEACDPALTIEELLGKEVADAILDDVVP